MLHYEPFKFGSSYFVPTSANDNSTIRLNYYPQPKPQKLATANCARILKGNFFATNGIVHVVEKVIPTATKTVLEIVEENDRLGFLRKGTLQIPI